MVDLITIGLFFVVACAVLNKLLAKKIVALELLDLSWKTIGFLGFIFFVLLINQLNQASMRRELSAFQKEAALKSVRRNIRR